MFKIFYKKVCVSEHMSTQMDYLPTDTSVFFFYYWNTGWIDLVYTEH